MGDPGRESLFGNVVRGAVAGGIATWLMDLVTTELQEQQTPADAARERAAQPDGKSSVTHLVALIERETGFQVGDDLRPSVELALHYGLGVIPGAVYGATRRWIPGLGAGRGLVSGCLSSSSTTNFSTRPSACRLRPTPIRSPRTSAGLSVISPLERRRIS